MAATDAQLVMYKINVFASIERHDLLSWSRAAGV